LIIAFSLVWVGAGEGRQSAVRERDIASAGGFESGSPEGAHLRGATERHGAAPAIDRGEIEVAHAKVDGSEGIGNEDSFSLNIRYEGCSAGQLAAFEVAEGRHFEPIAHYYDPAPCPDRGGRKRDTRHRLRDWRTAGMRPEVRPHRAKHFLAALGDPVGFSVTNRALPGSF
jgi:hypothetical protein